MIERYSRKEIRKNWDEKNKYQIWLDIEIAAAQAMEKLRIIPRGVSYNVRKKAKIDVNRIHKIESKVHHDMIAFLTFFTTPLGIILRFSIACAAAISGAVLKLSNRHVDIEFPEGLLNIEWKMDNNIYMTGKVSRIEKIEVNI